MIDTRFCAQIGTEKQNKYACLLASKAGYDALRVAVSQYMGCSVSKASRITINVKDASKFIDWLKEKAE